MCSRHSHFVRRRGGESVIVNATSRIFVQVRSHTVHKKTRVANSKDTMVALPLTFVPGPDTVLCARGKIAQNYEGTRRWRALIKKALGRYSRATSKIEKSMIVSEIVSSIRSASPTGGFVKEENGIYYDVGDRIAREKTGQALRDSLHGQYKSSTKAKRQHRRQMHAGIANNIESLLHTNREVSSRIQRLSSQAQGQDGRTPEVFVYHMFTKANLDILEAFKKDQTLRRQFTAVEQEQKRELLMA